LTLSANRSKVLNLGGVRYIDLISSTINQGPTARLIVGHPFPVFVGVNYLGTWKSKQQIKESSFTLEEGTNVVGGPHFQDMNGDGQINLEDFHPLGSPQPKFFGGIRNTIHYKNLTLNFF